jgi:AraC family cel operon transcriptional repressor
MPDVPRKRWDSYARQAGGLFHIARVAMPPRHRGDIHTHDFAELFFVESGQGLHLVNGERQPLVRGDLVFIRPDDCHRFEAGTGGLIFVNVAMPRTVIRTIELGYFPSEEDDWPWRPGGQPATTRLHVRQLDRASDWAERLAAGPPTKLLLDAFLLDLLSSRGGGLQAALPPWLAHAVDRYTTVEQFAGGAGRLAALAGRSPEHVNRIFRRLLGRSTSEYINDLRVEHAARRLRLSDRSVTEIAFECGITHVTYFYRIFGERMGISPSRYRRGQRMGMS